MYFVQLSLLLLLFIRKINVNKTWEKHEREKLTGIASRKIQTYEYLNINTMIKTYKCITGVFLCSSHKVKRKEMKMFWQLLRASWDRPKMQRMRSFIHSIRNTILLSLNFNFHSTTGFSSPFFCNNNFLLFYNNNTTNNSALHFK